jgi:glycosyltransferase involved in cell wall biosynthesis
MAEQSEKWMLQMADAIFVVSESLKEHVLELHKATKVRVVPNGVDPSRFSPAPANSALRQRLGLNNSLVIGFLGGLRPWHGVEILPDLLEALAPTHPSVKLLLVGDGPLRATLTTAFAQKNQLDKVVFAGTAAHEEIPEYIRLFDIALAPYPVLTHSFYFSPLKLFEYLACGVATVASDIGQISEIIRNNETGLLYAPGHLPSLAAACEALLKDAQLRARLGQAGAELVHKNYTWDHNVEILEETVRNWSPQKGS